MIQVVPFPLKLASNKKITQAIKHRINQAPRNLPMAFESLTLDAHDNGSSTWQVWDP